MSPVPRASALARALAAAGDDVVAQLLDGHRPDDAGRCRVCRVGGQSPRWPCALADAAAGAQRALNARPRAVRRAAGT